MKLIMLSGLPASGKSTWAHEQIAANPSIVRVNKDEIRLELATTGWTWSHENEQQVTAIRDARIANALKEGRDVISDDTNFARVHRTRLHEIANEYGAAFTEKFFPVDVEEAIRRDALREGTARVGAEVIRRMAKQYLPPSVIPYAHTDGLPLVVLCDLDGTAALITGRSPYDGGNCHLDQPNVPVRTVLRALHPTPVLYLSGRDDCHKDVTQTWLQVHMFPDGPLHMRKTGDRRKDAVVKSELFNTHVRGRYNVLFVLDDRNQVVDMWRSLGLTVFQVADGDF